MRYNGPPRKIQVKIRWGYVSKSIESFHHSLTQRVFMGNLLYPDPALVVRDTSENTKDQFSTHEVFIFLQGEKTINRQIYSMSDVSKCFGEILSRAR